MSRLRRGRVRCPAVVPRKARENEMNSGSESAHVWMNTEAGENAIAAETISAAAGERANRQTSSAARSAFAAIRTACTHRAAINGSLTLNDAAARTVGYSGG